MVVEAVVVVLVVAQTMVAVVEVLVLLYSRLALLSQHKVIV